MLALTADPTAGGYVRGRLYMVGIRPDTPLIDTLDVLDVVAMETPYEALKQRHERMGMALSVAAARAGRVDRNTWGMPPEHRGR